MILLISIFILPIAAMVVWALREKMPASSLRGWLLSLFPATSFVLLLRQTIQLTDTPQIFSTPWISSLNLEATLYFDALAALFALLVTGIGTLIIIYAGYYFAGDKQANRFLAYLFLFMGMMLGLVLAGDVLTLFVFWEGTSITSFLLVAYKYKYEEARRGAFKALFITGGGGIALLGGLLMVSYVAGGTDFATILSRGEALQSSGIYLLMLGLVALGAFTKSAQAPFHIWLPGAMSAPTPASAFLHSATMVKAGIYLLARFNPALGNTEAWFWLLTVVGAVTMVTGAYLGTKQTDLKALLAYSTISQLGILVMLIGQDSEIAFKALVVGVVAHAFYKSALFMLAGIVDLQAGTRQLPQLGGLRHRMPLTFGLVVVAALSLAGLPPLFGFLAKETLLATAIHPSLPDFVPPILVTFIVLAAAFKLVQAGLLVFDGFTGTPRDKKVKPIEAPYGMLLAPFVPAFFSLALGILPEPKAIAEFFGAAAAASYGDKVKVSFALWTGLNMPLYLSVLAIGLGAVLFWQRRRLIAWQNSLPNWSLNQLHDALLNGIDKGAWLATRLQTGKLRFYLSVMIVSMLLLVVYMVGGEMPAFPLTQPTPSIIRQEFDIIRLLALFATVVAAVATVVIKRDFFAVLALGVTGLGVAIYMAVEPAPDVALVQIVVDILATVVLVLAISRLPQLQRNATHHHHKPQWLTLFVAIVGGLFMTIITFYALTSRPRFSYVNTFYNNNAKELTGATDIVGAIIVDFRALDTLIEIAVFGLAGIGVYTLLRHAARKHNDHGQAIDRMTRLTDATRTTQGIGGTVTSVYLRSVADFLLPAALMIGAIHMIYGHVQPGDGFTAGVIISLAIGLKYVVFGFRETRSHHKWLRPRSIIAVGVLLVVVNGAMGALWGGYFLAPVDYGALLGVTLPINVKLSSGFVFEVAIALAVLGSASLMLDTLGRPAVDVDMLNEVGGNAGISKISKEAKR